jgi:hypothetical protein
MRVWLFFPTYEKANAVLACSTTHVHAHLQFLGLWLVPGVGTVEGGKLAILVDSPSRIVYWPIILASAG